MMKFPLPRSCTAGAPFPSAAAFMEFLANAARGRWQVELTAPDGLTYIIMTLFRIPAGKIPAMFGVAAQPADYDRWLCLSAGPFGAEDTAPILRYQIVVPGWYSFGVVPTNPTLAEPPGSMQGIKRATVIMETLAWAARLGTWAHIWYDAKQNDRAPDLRRITDLRIAPGDPERPSAIRATDIDKGQPRTFSVDKIQCVSQINLIANNLDAPNISMWLFYLADETDPRAERHPYDPEGPV